MATQTSSVLVVCSAYGGAFQSQAEGTSLRVALLSFGPLRCLRYDSGLERAFAYYEDVCATLAAHEGLGARMRGLISSPAAATILIENLSVPYTAPLIEEYVLACLSEFGRVLGVDVDLAAGEVYAHMGSRLARDAAAAAKTALHRKKKVGSWAWSMSITEDIPTTGNTVAQFQASGAAAVTAFHSLPRDILLLIFSYCPVRALIVVLKRVCRKWYRIAPLGISSLDLLGESRDRVCNNPILFAQFRHLRHWTVSRFPDTRVLRGDWRQGLTSLDIKETCPTFQDYTALTRIAQLRSHVPLLDICPLLSNSLTSITSLTLNISETTPLAPLVFLLRLATLSISFSGAVPSDWLISFLIQQRSTITDLTVNDLIEESLACITIVHFPHLRSLDITVDASEAFTGWLLLHHATLTSISLQFAQPPYLDIFHFPAEVAPAVRRLSCCAPTESHHSMMLLSVLSDLVNLTDLDLRDWRMASKEHQVTDVIASLHTQLVRLRMYLTLPAEFDKLKFHALKTLEICSWYGSIDNWDLPHLERLTWEPGTEDMRAIANIAKFVTKFKFTLRHLKFLLSAKEVHTMYPLVTDHSGERVPRLVALEEVMHTAQQNGLLSLQLLLTLVSLKSKSADPYVRKMRDLQRNFPWMEVTCETSVVITV